ncbi:MAG: hypothetical protein KKI13_05705 [Candidatus Omnitrophica bacterium]|nr:hypothetical protein [Candidatus Omnitrophota bacterium]
MDASGNTTTFQYNSLNQLTKTISAAPFSYETKYSYDENGNLKQADRQTDDPINPWQTIIYTYTILDRLESITDDLGNITHFDYDLNENRTKITDAESNITEYVYDERDLLWKGIQANNGEQYITEYAYDDNSNLREIKDAKGNITSYQYDGFDRLKVTIYANTTTELYTYDAASNLKTKTNQKNQLITYDYDALNRFDLKTYPDLSTVDYVYDMGSRLTNVIDSNGTIHYDYNEANKVRQVIYPGAVTVEYRYYPNGNRERLTYSDASYITYWYDELNRLTDIKNSSSQVITHYDYDALSRRKVELLNGTETIYDYDAISQLSNITNRTTGLTTISSFGYPVYDKVGNRKTMVVNSADTHTYTYDNIYQLTNIIYPDFSSTTYDYDEVGNRLSVINGGTTAYIPNNMNQYDSVGGVAYIYDDNGNLTSDGVNSYGYDYENRLISATTPTHVAMYTYDTFGRRICKIIDSTVTKFIYSGDQAICETDSAGSITAKYIYGIGIDEPILIEIGGETYYYHFDSLGSVVNLTNSSATVVESYSYDIYGKPAGASTIGNPYMFTGRNYDAETGLYYYRARYYDTRLGRFLQADPIKYLGGINVYSYCKDNPINWIDPFGLEVYITGHPVGKVGGHSAIALVPDNEKDFANDPRFTRNPQTGKLEADLSGGRSKEGMLTQYPHDLDRMTNPGMSNKPIKDPKGRSDTQLINDILDSASKYDNGLVYDPLAQGGCYNSNSYVRGVLNDAGISNPPLPESGHFYPGWTHPIPLQK